MEVIWDDLDDFENEELLSEDHLAFIKEHIQSIEDSNQTTYNWEEIKELQQIEPN